MLDVLDTRAEAAQHNIQLAAVLCAAQIRPSLPEKALAQHSHSKAPLHLGRAQVEDMTGSDQAVGRCSLVCGDFC